MTKFSASIVVIKDDIEQSIDLPVLYSTIGHNVIDISGLLEKLNLTTLDIGYQNTASCISRITYIDGKNGILMHRGMNINTLVDNNDFDELAYLLIYGYLPNRIEKHRFVSDRDYKKYDDAINTVLKSFPKNAAPMAMAMGVMSYLSALHVSDDSSEEYINQMCEEVISIMPVIVARIYAFIHGKKFQLNNQNLGGFTHSMLSMMFPENSSLLLMQKSEIIDKLFILHADHEQNASTSVMRSVSSTGSNVFACLAAAIASLWGPLHGGASSAVVSMLADIGSVDGIDAYLTKVKNKECKLMGFGHRVYKNYDPRANAIKQYVQSLSQQYSSNTNIAIAQKLEKVALSDSYFIERKLFPNVDFYSGIVYSTFDIQPELFTLLFASARVSGWVSQWKEALMAKSKIVRPRQLYQGAV